MWCMVLLRTTSSGGIASSSVWTSSVVPANRRDSGSRVTTAIPAFRGQILGRGGKSQHGPDDVW